MPARISGRFRGVPKRSRGRTRACTGFTQARAQASTNHSSGSFTESGALYCDATGWISWAGEITWSVQSTTDAQGGVHYIVMYNFSGVDGVDANGNPYQGSGGQQSRVNATSGGAYDGQFTYRYSLVGKNGLGITCTGTGHLVVNANGDATVNLDSPLSCSCK